MPEEKLAATLSEFDMTLILVKHFENKNITIII